MIAGRHAAHTGAGLQHDPRALVAQNGRECAFRIVAGERKRIGMADPRGLDLDQHFAGAGSVQIDLHDFEGFSRLQGDCCVCFHS